MMSPAPFHTFPLNKVSFLKTFPTPLPNTKEANKSQNPKSLHEPHPTIFVIFGRDLQYCSVVPHGVRA